MRLAIITESFLPRVNGVTRTVTALTAHLRRRGHRALLFAPGAGVEEHDGFEVVRVPGLSGWVYPDLTVSPLAPGMRHRLRDFDPDIVHLASPAALGVCGAWAARRLGVPVVAHYQTDLLAYARAYGGGLLAAAAGAAERRFHNRCTATYAPTPPMAEELRCRGFERVRVSGRGVDTTLFRPGRPGALAARGLWPAGDGPRVLCVTRLAREKGLDRVVRIAREHPELRLLVVGTGPMADELRRTAPPSMRLAGLREGDALADIYAAADVFLHPASTETFGQVIQEAMAAGVPVVGVRAGGVAWLVEEGRTGLLAEAPGDGLGEVLTRAVGGGDLPEMGAAARRAVAGRSWAATFDALLDDYAALARGRSHRIAA
ncbi:MAG: glycosyltransferase family 4 protein [Candidatus Dormibacteria bacterium]